VLRAAAQVGRVPKLLVWDSKSLVTLSQLHGHTMGVTHVAFGYKTLDKDASVLLASVGLDPQHRVLVHNWKTGQVVASQPGNAGKTFDVSWNPNVRREVLSHDSHCAR
jgi:hypothetical protein